MIRHVAPTLEAARAVIAGDVGLIVVEGDSCRCDETLGAVQLNCDRCPRLGGSLTYAPELKPFVRAVESGERIEIAATCETCAGDTNAEDHPCAKTQREARPCRAVRWGAHPRFDGPHEPHHFYYGPNDCYTGTCRGSGDGSHCNCSMTHDVCHWCGLEWLADGDVRCPSCTAGLVVFGSVQATAVLEIWHYERQGSHRGVAHLCVVDAIGDAGPWVLEYDTEGQQIDDHAAALSVYGDPASLIGRYAIAVTDPRRTE